MSDNNFGSSPRGETPTRERCHEGGAMADGAEQGLADAIARHGHIRVTALPSMAPFPRMRFTLVALEAVATDLLDSDADVMEALADVRADGVRCMDYDTATLRNMLAPYGFNLTDDIWHTIDGRIYSENYWRQRAAAPPVQVPG